MKYIFLAVIKLYRLTLSKILPPCCRYYPSCSEYGLTAIRRFGAVRGGYLTLWRIMRCNPFGAGGIDPVPQKFCFHPERLPVPPDFGIPDDDSADYLSEDIKRSYKDNLKVKSTAALCAVLSYTIPKTPEPIRSDAHSSAHTDPSTALRQMKGRGHNRVPVQYHRLPPRLHHVGDL